MKRKGRSQGGNKKRKGENFVLVITGKCYSGFYVLRYVPVPQPQPQLRSSSSQRRESSLQIGHVGQRSLGNHGNQGECRVRNTPS